MLSFALGFWNRHRLDIYTNRRPRRFDTCMHLLDVDRSGPMVLKFTEIWWRVPQKWNCGHSTLLIGLGTYMCHMACHQFRVKSLNKHLSSISYINILYELLQNAVIFIHVIEPSFVMSKPFWIHNNYRQTFNLRPTSVGNTLVDHSDVVGASPFGAAPTTSSCST